MTVQIAKKAGIVVKGDGRSQKEVSPFYHCVLQGEPGLNRHHPRSGRLRYSVLFFVQPHGLSFVACCSYFVSNSGDLLSLSMMQGTTLVTSLLPDY